jgi:hypothetical protein
MEKDDEELKRELIKKHLEFYSGGFFESSIQHYLKTGKPSGSLFMALKQMMEEYSQAKSK